MPASHRPIAFATLLWCVILRPGAVPIIAQDTLEKLEKQVQEELAQSDEDGSCGGGQAASKAEPGYFGIVADDRQQAGGGVRILHVVPGGPAHQAQLRSGDRITAIDGMPIHQMADLARVMTTTVAGTRLRVAFERDDDTGDVLVTLSTRPPPHERPFAQFGRIPESNATGTARAGDATIAPSPLGLQIAPLTENARRQWDLPLVSGVLVISVAAGSAADRAGVPAGSVVLAVDGRAVRAPDHLRELVAAAPPGAPLEITYYNRGQTFRTQMRRVEQVPAKADTAPEAILPPPAPEPTDVMQRLGRLERRLQRLEQKIQQLEGALDGSL